MIGRTFWAGIKVILPLAITIAILYWLYMAIERFFGYFMKLIVGKYYFPGLGFIIGIMLVFVVGFLMNAWLGRKLHMFGEHILRKIPLVKWLYNSLTDLMSFFDSRKSEGQTVVMVSLGEVRVLGFITREDFTGLTQGMGAPGEISVFLPMSYQLGGYMINVSRESVKPLDMTVDAALRYIITAGMVTKK